MKNNNFNFNMNFYLFVFLYFLYALFSIFLWTMTTQGWSAMLWMIFFPIYYIALPLLFFLITFLSAYLQKNELLIRVKIKSKLFIVTIFVQILGLLLNTGDWGDRYGSHLKSPVFIINRLDQIWLEPIRNELVLQGIIAKLLYFTLFYIFLIGTLITWKSASDKVQKRSRSQEKEFKSKGYLNQQKRK